MLRNIVRRKRTENELTQSELGELVGVTRQTIAFIEKGEYTPSVALSLRLAEALGTPIAELFWLEKDDQT
ncbi:MAG: helix-turn-helix transcriptional regulator [Microbacteriaceae bacterium]